jgi:hypothetical protein
MKFYLLNNEALHKESEKAADVIAASPWTLVERFQWAVAKACQRLGLDTPETLKKCQQWIEKERKSWPNEHGSRS